MSESVTTAAASAVAPVSGAVEAGSAKAGEAVEGTVKAPKRTAAQIEADLDVTRARLVENVDQLKEYVKPANVVARQVERVKAVFVDEHGGVRVERVAGAAALLVGVVVVRSLLRRRGRD